MHYHTSRTNASPQVHGGTPGPTTSNPTGETQGNGDAEMQHCTPLKSAVDMGSRSPYNSATRNHLSHPHTSTRTISLGQHHTMRSCGSTKIPNSQSPSTMLREGHHHNPYYGMMRPQSDALDFAMAEDTEIKEIAENSGTHFQPTSTSPRPIPNLPVQYARPTAAVARTPPAALASCADDGSGADLHDGTVSLGTLPHGCSILMREWTWEEVETNEKHLNYPFISLPSSCNNTGDTEERRRRLEQRRKQIAYGKDTDGYRTYRLVIPQVGQREFHNPMHPMTPRPENDCSKRTFDKYLNAWRRQLHQWDGVRPGAGTSDHLSMGVATLGELGLAPPLTSSPVIPHQEDAPQDNPINIHICNNRSAPVVVAHRMQSIAHQASRQPSSGGLAPSASGAGNGHNGSDSRSPNIYFLLSNSTSPQLFTAPAGSARGGSVSVCTPSRQGPEVDAAFFLASARATTSAQPPSSSPHQAPHHPCTRNRHYSLPCGRSVGGGAGHPPSSWAPAEDMHHGYNSHSDGIIGGGAGGSGPVLSQLACRATPFGSNGHTPHQFQGCTPMMALLRKDLDLIGTSPADLSSGPVSTPQMYRGPQVNMITNNNISSANPANMGRSGGCAGRRWAPPHAVSQQLSLQAEARGNLHSGTPSYQPQQ